MDKKCRCQANLSPQATNDNSASAARKTGQHINYHQLSRRQRDDLSKKAAAMPPTDTSNDPRDRTNDDDYGDEDEEAKLRITWLDVQTSPQPTNDLKSSEIPQLAVQDELWFSSTIGNEKERAYHAGRIYHAIKWLQCCFDSHPRRQECERVAFHLKSLLPQFSRHCYPLLGIPQQGVCERVSSHFESLLHKDEADWDCQYVMLEDIYLGRGSWSSKEWETPLDEFLETQFGVPIDPALKITMQLGHSVDDLQRPFTHSDQVLPQPIRDCQISGPISDDAVTESVELKWEELQHHDGSLIDLELPEQLTQETVLQLDRNIRDRLSDSESKKPRHLGLSLDTMAMTLRRTGYPEPLHLSEEQLAIVKPFLTGGFVGHDVMKGVYDGNFSGQYPTAFSVWKTAFNNTLSTLDVEIRGERGKGFSLRERPT